MVGLREHLWTSRDEQQLRGFARSRCVSVDPGANGGVALWSEWGSLEDAETYGKSTECVGYVAQYIASFAPRVLVVESQYLGSKAGAPLADSSLKLARAAGYLIGAAAALIVAKRGGDVELVLVRPATWQRWLRCGEPSRSAKKRAALVAAAEALDKRPNARAAQRQGLADAYCIGRAWWDVMESPDSAAVA